MWMLLEPNGPRPRRIAEIERPPQYFDSSELFTSDRDAVLEAALAGAIRAAPLPSNLVEADPGALAPERGGESAELSSAGRVAGSESSGSTSPAAGETRREAVFQPLLGAAPAALRSAATGASLKLFLYMHPGRVSLGERDSLVLADQFDLSRAKRFDSLARAEREIQFGVGFLIEVREPFLDERGVSRPSGCYFSGRMD
jgi:hypothetical protein